ncbi:Endoribonuclease L-PSP [Artomyces pyxidatus]|uniref:Endoribonuclease L-PSP n=1 Tax=Artomyces pyxidatus TaxID=48021 RepID=A0ACB8T6G1_9AGAM|nr:Endoribonuclease L-PSP [Artomyces pyxidatus]
MVKEIVFTEDALPPLPIYCDRFMSPSAQAVVSRGTVYASGNIGITRDMNLVEGGVEAQTRAALENLSKVLKAAGSGLEHVLKVNVYLTNLPRDFQPMNGVYSQFFEQGKMPARTCIGVAALPLGADVEIECTAEVPQA